MKISTIEDKLWRLQAGMEFEIDRPERTKAYEELYWSELNRLRTLGRYDLLPSFVNWLADYRCPGRYIGQRFLTDD